MPSSSIKPGEPFSFQCRLCGECCCGRMKVFLNPRDVENLLTHFSLLDIRDLRAKGWLAADTGQNGLLFPRLKFSGHKPGFCPFVVNRWDENTGNTEARCSLHNTRAKPLVCRLAPLAREVDFSGGGPAPVQRWFVQEPVAGCPGFLTRQNQDLDSWLRPLEEELERELDFFRLLESRLLDGQTPEEIFLQFFGLSPEKELFCREQK